MKTLTKNWRGHSRTGTCQHTETWSKYFDRHSHLSQLEENKCLWTHNKDVIFVVCLQTFALFWLRKVAMPVKIFHLSFCVPVLLWPPIFGKSFHSPFPILLMKNMLKRRKESERESSSSADEGRSAGWKLH